MVKAFDDWERFVNEAPPGLPLLAQAALMHYQFEAIHPFLDGNGRLGRLLIVLFLITRGRLARPVLSVSPYFEERRDVYIGHLQSVQETGDLDPWLRFFATAVADSATDGVRRALLLVDLRERYRHRVPAQANLHSLIDFTFESPVLTGRLVEAAPGRHPTDRTPTPLGARRPRRPQRAVNRTESPAPLGCTRHHVRPHRGTAGASSRATIRFAVSEEQRAATSRRSGTTERRFRARRPAQPTARERHSGCHGEA